MQQFKSWRRSSMAPAQPQSPSHDPVLTSEDEAFLRNIMADQANNRGSVSPPSETPLDLRSPVSPLEPDAPNPNSLQSPVSPEEFGRELGEEERKAREQREEEQRNAQKENQRPGSAAPEPATVTRVDSSSQPEKKKSRFSWLKRKTTKKNKEPPKETAKEPTAASNDSQSNPPSDGAQNGNSKQEDEDMTEILERLNLAADNNRVISLSPENQELLRKFKLIFKDLVNGVPTAYHDLEMLLTNGNRQLQSTYSQLPGFLQKLIEKLPEKWTESLAPEIIAAASERASKSGVNVESVGKAAAAANKMGLKVPSLKELVGKPAAIVGMLRSIVAFLRARFPAVLGLNVLWSLALFILLFVLWYCHKRGREVRLENERLVTEDEIQNLNQDDSEDRIRETETRTTTAPKGASAAEVREGMKQAEQAHGSSEASQAENEPASAPEQSKPAPEQSAEVSSNANAKPARSKSRLSIFGRPSPKPQPATANIEPYPGT